MRTHTISYLAKTFTCRNLDSLIVVLESGQPFYMAGAKHCAYVPPSLCNIRRAHPCPQHIATSNGRGWTWSALLT